MKNPFTQEEETECYECGKETNDLYPVSTRDDGSWFHRIDNSFGIDDVYLCFDCFLKRIED